MIYKFGDIANNVTEKRSPKPEDSQNYIGLEHLDSGSLYVNRYGIDVELKGDKLVMHKGDVLLGKRNAYLRRAAIAPHDGLFSAHGMILRPKDVIASEFFPFFIASDKFFDDVIRISVGGLSPTVNWKDLKELEFDLPSLAEQKVLAEKLWAAYEVKQSYLKMIEATEEMVKSQFIEMFGDPSTETKWQTKKLKELGILERGVSKARPRNAPDLLGGQYPLIQTGDITEAKLYIKDYHQTYSEIGLAQSKMWKRGTLCITIAANIAQTAILDFDACFPDSVVGFIPYNVDTVFIHFWFSFIQKVLEQQAPQTAQKNINLKILSELDVIEPPKELQSLFVSIVHQADKSISELRKSIDAIDKVIKSLINENL